MLSIDKCKTCMHYIQFQNIHLTAGGMCTVAGGDNVKGWEPKSPTDSCPRHMTKNVDNILEKSRTENSIFTAPTPDIPPPPPPQAQLGEIIEVLPIPPGELIWIGKQIFVIKDEKGKEHAFDRSSCRIQHAQMPNV